MAHIVSFAIEGLAGRSGVYTAKLRTDINIFFGLNGTGKTSLLKILHSALTGKTRLLRTATFKSAVVKVVTAEVIPLHA